MKKIKKIAIHSVPRSGSSWLGEIFNSSPDVVYRYQPLFSYAFKDYLNEYSNREEIDEFFEKIAKSDDDFLLQKEKRKNKLFPEFKKSKSFTHIVYKEVRYHHILENMLKVHPEIIVVGLIRNPLAVINSFLRAPREFRRDLGWRELEEWRYAPKKNQGKKEEFYGFEKWKEVTKLFLKLEKLYPDRFIIVRYSKLIKNPIIETKRIFNFCNLKFEKQTEEFLIKSMTINNKDAYSVFKIKKSDDEWKEKLDKRIINEIIKDLTNTELEEFIYDV